MVNFLRGKFMKLPLHPLMVHLPIGLWVGSLVCDIAFMFSDNANFAVASYYMMLVGIGSVLLAAPTGLAEMLAIPKNTAPHNVASTHMALNVFVTVLYILNFMMRNSLEGGAPNVVTAWHYFLSLASVCILALSGYLGGMLVYNYGIGQKRTEVEEQEKIFRKSA